jgi:hypothetical protein
MAIYIPGKWIHKVWGGLMLAVVIVVFLPAILATRELKNYCGALAIGSPIAEVKAEAEARGYRLSQLVDGRTMIDDVRSFGRPTCTLRFDPGSLLAAEYSSND